jgi:hypothetical protein
MILSVSSVQVGPETAKVARNVHSTMRGTCQERGYDGVPLFTVNINRRLSKQLEGRAPARPHLCMGSCMFGAFLRRNSRKTGLATTIPEM